MEKEIFQQNADAKYIEKKNKKLKIVCIIFLSFFFFFNFCINSMDQLLAAAQIMLMEFNERF